MCGITAFVGHQEAVKLLIRGLHRLEYRGYDSAGVGILSSDGKNAQGNDTYKINVVKAKGKVQNLQDTCENQNLPGTCGIAHTRWATHGAPTDLNAHPHLSEDGNVAVVHNGIVENYYSLKTALQQKGFTFKSETDTEVLAQLVSDIRREYPQLCPSEVVRKALSLVDGAFGCCFLFGDTPGTVIGARRGSPMILGIMDNGEYYLASDGSAIVEHTKTVEYLKDQEMVEFSEAGYVISSLNTETPITREHSLAKLDFDLETIEKGGYKHFMLKEIMEQPKVLRDCMAGRANSEAGTLRLGGIEEQMERILSARRLIICACGTSFHSGLVAEYLIESVARINVEVEYASEFRYRNPVLYPDDVLIAVSQSGETADTLAAIREAKRHGCLTLGIVNVVGSSIARETECGIYLHIGPEIGVASTKAFTGQLVVLTMLALVLAHRGKQITDEQLASYVRELAGGPENGTLGTAASTTSKSGIPEKMARVLSQNHAVFDICKSFRFAQSFLYLGRGLNYPVALEGALKLKEISYIHAEGYPAAEMKHGPIALIDRFMPVVIIAPKGDSTYDKLKSNMEEVLARGGCVIAITEEDNEDLDEKAECVLRFPKDTSEVFIPLLSVIPLQLMSYYIADMRKCEVDQPRNLAKSVTVE